MWHLRNIWMTMLLLSILISPASTRDEFTSSSVKLCPCLSYYSKPDYKCLQNVLEKNQTLLPRCLNLLQAIDHDHAFKITESYDFRCGDDKVYLYAFTKFASEKQLITEKQVCETTFRWPIVFEIASPRSEFFQVVSRNLEALKYTKITCSLSLWAVRIDWEDLCSQQLENLDRKYWQLRWTHELLLTESFSIDKNGTASSIAHKYSHFENSGVGFLPAVSDFENIDFGKFIVDSWNSSAAGHLLKFSCEWGMFSSHFGKTNSCWHSGKLDSKDCACSVQSSSTKSAQLKSSLAPVLYQSYQWVFENSMIIIGMKWNKNEIPSKEIKSWKLECKFFLSQDTLFQPEICVSCFKNDQNCSECWELASLQGQITPFLVQTLPSRQIFAEYRFQTNFANIAFENGTFIVIPNKRNRKLIPIFQYDYFFGNYFGYLHPTHGPTSSYFSSSVVIPAYQNTPTMLTTKQISLLSTLCRVRAKFKDNSFSKWSNTIRATFNKDDTLSPFIMVVFDHPDKNLVEIIFEMKKTQNTIKAEVYGEASISPKKYGFGCWHNLLGKRYVFLQQKTSPSSYQLHYGKNGKLISCDVYLEDKPLDVKCAALHPFIVWTQHLNNTEFKVYKLDLDSNSGEPKASGNYQLSGTNLCMCSQHKFVTSSTVEVIYTSRKEPTNVEIAIGCGSTICAIDPARKKFAAMDVQKFDEKHPIDCFAVDEVNIYFTTYDDPTMVKVTPISDLYHVYSVAYKGKNRKILRITAVDPNGTHAYLYPAPPKHCLDPHVVETQTTVALVGTSELAVTVTTMLENSIECSRFARPEISIEIFYSIVRTNFNVTKHIGNELWLPCRSFPNHKCHHLPGVVRPGNTIFTSNIPEVVLNKWYLIEIQVKANVSWYDLWYTGHHQAPGQTVQKWFFTKLPSHKSWIVPLAVGIVVSLLLAALISGIFYWSYTRKTYMYRHLNRLSAKEIQKEEKLGEGNFGEVWKATLGKKTVIVVKMLKESATDREEKYFREEALLLSKFSCNYIVQALGICLQSRPIMLALEFLNGGSLNLYLVRDDTRAMLSCADLLHIAEDALKGCIYLEEEGYIHRDIASRNCLVVTTSDTDVKPKCVKLSDFGMAKDIGAEFIYRSQDADVLPIAWTAPEAFSGKFSTKSDVWAFGVLIWEIFTWAATPYGRCSETSGWHICPMAELSYDEIEFKVCAEKKNLLSFPNPCTATYFCPALKNVLNSCWQYASDERPSFKQLQKYLNGAKAEVVGQANSAAVTPATWIGQLKSVSEEEGKPPSIKRKLPAMSSAYRAVTEEQRQEPSQIQNHEEPASPSNNDGAVELLPLI